MPINDGSCENKENKCFLKCNIMLDWILSGNEKFIIKLLVSFTYIYHHYNTKALNDKNLSGIKWEQGMSQILLPDWGSIPPSRLLHPVLGASGELPGLTADWYTMTDWYTWDPHLCQKRNSRGQVDGVGREGRLGMLGRREGWEALVRM